MHLDQPQCPDDILGGHQILPRGQSHAVGVVMAEHHTVGTALEGCRHHILDLQTHPVAGAVPQPEQPLDAAAAIQRSQQGAFLHSPGKLCHQVFDQLVGGLHAFFSVDRTLGIVSADLRQKMQHPGGGGAYPLHCQQILLGSIQHPGKVSEPVHEDMGKAVGVLAGVGDIKDIFQRFVGFQTFQSVLLYPGAHPLAVPLMLAAFLRHGHSPFALLL